MLKMVKTIRKVEVLANRCLRNEIGGKKLETKLQKTALKKHHVSEHYFSLVCELFFNLVSSLLSE